jgi:hypothetical protein
MHTLAMRKGDELNFMIFGFGYFLVRLLDEKKITEDECNKIIDAINAASANNSEAILDVTVRAPDSLWQRIYIGPRGQLILRGTNEAVTDDCRPFCVNNFEDNGVPLRDENILAHATQCLCYGKKSMLESLRSLYEMNARGSDQKILDLINTWRGFVAWPTITLPLNIYSGAIKDLNLKQFISNGPVLEDIKYLCILNEFRLVEQRQQIAQLNSTKNKKAIFIFAFAGLIILSLAIIAAANIISWANLIKIALLSSIAAKAGIAAAGIVIGGVLLFFANRLRYKKNIFGCPCDESCRKHCVREENSQEELLARSKGITQ